MSATTLGIVDLAMLVLLAVSIVVGVLRGLVFEVMALAGWVVAYFVATWYGPQLWAALPVGTPGSGINRAASFALVFVAVLVAWALLAKLVRLIIHATPLSLADRAAGAAFGLVRGGVLLLVLATVVRYTPAAQSPLWQGSVGAGWLDRALAALWPLLPQDVAPWLGGGARPV